MAACQQKRDHGRMGAREGDREQREPLQPVPDKIKIASASRLSPYAQRSATRRFTPTNTFPGATSRTRPSNAIPRSPSRKQGCASAPTATARIPRERRAAANPPLNPKRGSSSVSPGVARERRSAPPTQHPHQRQSPHVLEAVRMKRSGLKPLDPQRVKNLMMAAAAGQMEAGAGGQNIQTPSRYPHSVDPRLRVISRSSANNMTASNRRTGVSRKQPTTNPSVKKETVAEAPESHLLSCKLEALVIDGKDGSKAKMCAKKQSQKTKASPKLVSHLKSPNTSDGTAQVNSEASGGISSYVQQDPSQAKACNLNKRTVDVKEKSLDSEGQQPGMTQEQLSEVGLALENGGHVGVNSTIIGQPLQSLSKDFINAAVIGINSPRIVRTQSQAQSLPLWKSTEDFTNAEQSGKKRQRSVSIQSQVQEPPPQGTCENFTNTAVGGMNSPRSVSIKSQTPGPPLLKSIEDFTNAELSGIKSPRSVSIKSQTHGPPLQQASENFTNTAVGGTNSQRSVSIKSKAQGNSLQQTSEDFTNAAVGGMNSPRSVSIKSQTQGVPLQRSSENFTNAEVGGMNSPRSVSIESQTQGVPLQQTSEDFTNAAVGGTNSPRSVSIKLQTQGNPLQESSDNFTNAVVGELKSPRSVRMTSQVQGPSLQQSSENFTNTALGGFKSPRSVINNSQAHGPSLQRSSEDRSNAAVGGMTSPRSVSIKSLAPGLPLQQQSEDLTDGAISGLNSSSTQPAQGLPEDITNAAVGLLNSPISASIPSQAHGPSLQQSSEDLANAAVSGMNSPRFVSIKSQSQGNLLQRSSDNFTNAGVGEFKSPRSVRITSQVQGPLQGLPGDFTNAAVGLLNSPKSVSITSQAEGPSLRQSSDNLSNAAVGGLKSSSTQSPAKGLPLQQSTEDITNAAVGGLKSSSTQSPAKGFPLQQSTEDITNAAVGGLSPRISIQSQAQGKITGPDYLKQSPRITELNPSFDKHLSIPGKWDLSEINENIDLGNTSNQAEETIEEKTAYTIQEMTKHSYIQDVIRKSQGMLVLRSTEQSAVFIPKLTFEFTPDNSIDWTTAPQLQTNNNDFPIKQNDSSNAKPCTPGGPTFSKSVLKRSSALPGLLPPAVSISERENNPPPFHKIVDLSISFQGKYEGEEIPTDIPKILLAEEDNADD